MKKYVRLLMGLLIAGWWSASCSSDHDDIPSEASGKGGVRIGLSTDTGFSSRAVDESEYKDVNNYTIEIWKDGSKLKSSLYKDLEGGFWALDDGENYTIKAFYGTDELFSYEKMYVEGSGTFSVDSDTATVSVACKPTCAKIMVKFNAELNTYFADYYMVFKTKEEGKVATWNKTTTGPLYFKVGQKNESVEAEIWTALKDSPTAYSKTSVTYSFTPAQQRIINVAPQVATGSINLVITIDDSVVKHEIPIEVPSDWV